MARFCASCTRDDDGTLILETLDGKNVWLCWTCREGPVSLFHFEELADAPLRHCNRQLNGHKQGGKPTRIGS